MTAAVDLPAWTFMVAAVIGLAVWAGCHLINQVRTRREAESVRRLTQLRKRQLDTLCARDRVRGRQ